MVRRLLLALFGISLGLAAVYGIFNYRQNKFPGSQELPSIPFVNRQKEIVGFLPYWLLDRAKQDYSNYLTTLTYFSLSVGPDGKLVKLSSPQETEPGWNALSSGKADIFLNNAKSKNLNLSLAAFSGNQDAIANLMNSPITNADNLVSDIEPVMKQYGFSNLNLDIEYTSEASKEAQLNFTTFTSEVKKNLDEKKLGTLSVDVAPGVFDGKSLIDPVAVSKIADKIIVMAYDYHFPGSYVTGPVAPINGFGTVAEYDIEAAIKAAKKVIPSQQLILGMPLYGYEWETIDDFPRAATIPGTGIVASASRVQDLLKSCNNCMKGTDEVAQEPYVTFKDQVTGTIHQIFYPDESSTRQKTDFVKNQKLEGIALWALGYEDQNILSAIADFK